RRAHTHTHTHTHTHAHALTRSAPCIFSVGVHVCVLAVTSLRQTLCLQFMGVEIPTKYGGSGFSFLSACLAVEEIAKVDASVAVCVDVQNTLVNNVFGMWANDEIKERVWPRLATKSVGSFCLTEPGSGSDAFALKTRAEKKGDYYVINGGCAHRAGACATVTSSRRTHRAAPRRTHRAHHIIAAARTATLQAKSCGSPTPVRLTSF
ncbi:hypothetical protein EON67_07455, partial [archaeon]